MKTNYRSLIENIILYGEILNTFPWDDKWEKDAPAIKHCTGSLRQCNKRRKSFYKHRIGIEEINVCAQIKSKSKSIAIPLGIQCEYFQVSSWSELSEQKLLSPWLKGSLNGK